MVFVKLDEEEFNIRIIEVLDIKVGCQLLNVFLRIIIGLNLKVV